MAIGPGIIDTNDKFLNIKSDNDIIRESIIRILLTLPGERINNPLFGSKFKTYLFSMDDDLFKEDVEAEIRSALTKWEPRVSVNTIETSQSENPNKLNITISVTNINSSEDFDVEFDSGIL